MRELELELKLSRMTFCASATGLSGRADTSLLPLWDQIFCWPPVIHRYFAETKTPADHGVVDVAKPFRVLFFPLLRFVVCSICDPSAT